MVKITWPYLIKGVVYAFLLMIGTFVGLIMRARDVQGFTIWGVVSAINVVATVIVFSLLKADLTAKKEKQQAPQKESKKSEKKKEVSKKTQSSEEKKFETEADKKKK